MGLIWFGSFFVGRVDGVDLVPFFPSFLFFLLFKDVLAFGER